MLDGFQSMLTLLKKLKVLWGWVWPSPWTLLGLAIGMIGCIRGGRIECYRGTIVCWGPWLCRWLQRAPIPGGASAMTFGHTILARNEFEMRNTHDHELVHVRQFEKWGVFFVPAYFAASLWLWCSGRDSYRENPFEQEAYREDSTRIKLRT